MMGRGKQEEKRRDSEPEVLSFENEGDKNAEVAGTLSKLSNLINLLLLTANLTSITIDYSDGNH